MIGARRSSWVTATWLASAAQPDGGRDRTERIGSLAAVARLLVRRFRRPAASLVAVTGTESRSSLATAVGLCIWCKARAAPAFTRQKWRQVVHPGKP